MSNSPRVAVWVCRTDACEKALLALEASHRLLTPPEAERARAFLDPRVRAQWSAAHVVLHLVLRASLGRPVAFETPSADGSGKPKVRDWPGDFSLSHSGGWTAVAVAAHGPVGVDVEVPRAVLIDARRRSLIIGAGRALVAGVADHTAAEAEFFAAWTGLEALAKSTGLGMGRLLHRLEITGTGRDDDGIAERARALAASELAGLAAVCLDLGDAGVAAALAHPVGAAVEPLRRLPGDPEALARLAAGEPAH